MSTPIFTSTQRKVMGFVVIVVILLFVIYSSYQSQNRRHVRSQAINLINDVIMMSNSAEQYAIENGFKEGMTVRYDSLVAAHYFTEGHHNYGKGEAYIQQHLHRTL